MHHTTGTWHPYVRGRVACQVLDKDGVPQEREDHLTVSENLIWDEDNNHDIRWLVDAVTERIGSRVFIEHWCAVERKKKQTHCKTYCDWYESIRNSCGPCSVTSISTSSTSIRSSRATQSTFCLWKMVSVFQIWPWKKKTQRRLSREDSMLYADDSVRLWYVQTFEGHWKSLRRWESKRRAHLRHAH